jgi:hypothetical protein
LPGKRDTVSPYGILGAVDDERERDEKNGCRLAARKEKVNQNKAGKRKWER